MDPNANYTERQALLAAINSGNATDEQVERYHELRTAYIEWVANGGFRADADPGRPEVTEFLAGYVECALWSTNDETDENTGGEPLSENYSIDDIDDETLAEMAADCIKFQTECATELAAIHDQLAAMPKDESTADEMAGHLFWLTRNGHGTGFWDRDLGAVGDLLTEVSERFGEAYLNLGDDGKIS